MASMRATGWKVVVTGGAVAALSGCLPSGPPGLNPGGCTEPDVPAEPTDLAARLPITARSCNDDGSFHDVDGFAFDLRRGSATYFFDVTCQQLQGRGARWELLDTTGAVVAAGGCTTREQKTEVDRLRNVLGIRVIHRPTSLTAEVTVELAGRR